MQSSIPYSRNHDTSRLRRVGVRSVLTVSALCTFGLLTWWPSASFDFLNWDDAAYIEHNELIRDVSLKNLAGIFTEPVTRNYAPLTILSFLADFQIWGMNPFGYHLSNIILHLINTILVCTLIRRLTGSEFIAMTTAALFMVHPVQVESVVWISSRKGLLCAMLMLAACVRRMKPGAASADDGWYIALLALALLAKAQAVVLPPIILLYDVLIRRRSFAESLPCQIIPGLMSLLLLLITVGAQNTELGGVRGHMDLSLLSIIAVDVTILWRYVGMLLWPQNLCVLYDPPTTGIAVQVMAGTAGWALAAFVLMRVRRTQPIWLLGGLSAFLLMFPVLNFFRITTLMNDRYLYLPCVIAFAMLAGAIQFIVRTVTSLVSRRSESLPVLCNAAIVGAMLAALQSQTSNYMPVWKTPLSLWTYAVNRSPQIPVVRIQYALTLYDSGRTAEAVEVIQLALQECRPDELDRNRMTAFVSQWKEELARIPPAQNGAAAVVTSRIAGID